MKPRVIVPFATLLLSACATTYQPYSYFGGGGYRDAQLGENIFKVTFEANGYTSSSKAADLALLRAADLATARGFSFFVVVAEADNSSAMAYTTPTTTTATVTSTGNTARATAQTYGGQTFLISFPTPSLTILCFKDKPAINGLVYEAVVVAQSMKAQYRVR